MATLITGIAGGLARRTAARLMAGGRAIVGVDEKDAEAIEDVFRGHAIDAVLHLGGEGDVVGSQRIMDLCLSYGITSLVVLSTFHVYGASPRNPTPISEDDPLRAGRELPELAFAVQRDDMASTWVFQHEGVRTCVLRPTNIVGPTMENAMSRLLRLPRVPYIAGYNPMTQFIDEDDLARAMTAALVSGARGVYNVAGGAVVPWRTALELAGKKTFPLPSALVKGPLRSFSSFPEHLVDFLKFPCVISDALFRRATGYSPAVSVRDTLASTAAGAR